MLSSKDIRVWAYRIHVFVVLLLFEELLAIKGIDAFTGFRIVRLRYNPKQKYGSSTCERVLSARVFRSLLSRSSGDGDDGAEEYESYDIEALRKRYENLMGSNCESRGKEKKLSDYPKTIRQKIIPTLIQKLHEKLVQSQSAPPTMTAVARERRLREAALLKALESSDVAVPELWGLWFAEKGPGPAAELLDAEEIASKGPLYWDEAEIRLWNLIQTHGIYWSEPVNRLATLMYLQGRLEESKKLCELVLAVKPWHFGAISGVVMIYAALGDTVNARIWADRRLPPIEPAESNHQRVIWVQRALTEATDTMNPTLYDDNEDAEIDDAWQ